MIQKRHSSNFDTVVQGNSLMEATHNLNKNELLAFKKIISMVDTKYRERKLQFSKREIVNYLFPKLKNKQEIHNSYYERAKKYCLKLLKVTLIFYETGKSGHIDAMSVCSRIFWPFNERDVLIHFSSEIMPLIFDLKKYFTQYQVGIIQNLNSRHSIRLYEYFRLNLHAKESEYTWIVPFDELKRILGIENKTTYGRFNNFNTKILQRCLPEINEKTDLQIKCTYERDYRRVRELTFTAKNKYPKTQREIKANKKLWDEKPLINVGRKG